MTRTPEQQRAIVDRILRAEHDPFYIRDEALCEAVEALANGDPLPAETGEPK